jgi:hypothetical protein
VKQLTVLYTAPSIPGTLSSNPSASQRRIREDNVDAFPRRPPVHCADQWDPREVLWKGFDSRLFLKYLDTALDAKGSSHPSVSRWTKVQFTVPNFVPSCARNCALTEYQSESFSNDLSLQATYQKLLCPKGFLTFECHRLIRDDRGAQALFYN